MSLKVVTAEHTASSWSQ